MRRRLPLILFVLTVGLVSSVAVSSAAAGPANFNPNPVAFGGQQVGTTSNVQTVTITNTGDTDMTVTGDGVTKGGTDAGDFSVSNDTCANAVLQAGAATSCSADVTFSPSSAGSESAELDIASDSPTSPDSVALSGTGTAAPEPTLSAPGSANAGNVKVGTSSNTTVHVTNTGNAALSVTSVSASDTTTGAGFGVVGNDCSGIAPGNGCDITISFSPTVAGPLTGVLSISSNDPSSPTAVSLTGTGTVPQASVNGPISFATPRNVAQTKPVTLTNTGNAPLKVVGADLSGDSTFTRVVSSGTCGNATLAPGGSCSAQIKFLPTTSAAASATVTFTDDDGSVGGSTQTVSLQGTVLLPDIHANPTAVTFSDLALGRITNPTTVTVSNTGSANLNISGVHLNGKATKSFVLGNQTCTSGTIAPGHSCTVNVRFAPPKTGQRQATLVLVNDAGADLQVGLSGTGQLPADATNLRAATSCSDARFSWRSPDTAGFSKVILVRNSKRFPRNPEDGVHVRHAAGSATDRKPRQFHTYRYTLFAIYRSYNNSHSYSSHGVHAKVHLGRICKPRDGSIITDLTPRVDWTNYTGSTSYAFILQRGSTTLLVRYGHKSSYQFPKSWTYGHAKRSLVRGATYNFYLYAYTRAHRNGLIIGHTTFTER